MRRSKQQLEQRIEGWITHSPSGPEDGVAGLVGLLRSEAAAQPDAPEHAARLAREAAAQNVSPRPDGRFTRPLPKRWRRRAMVSTFLSSLAGKLAIGSVALATTTGGLAATGNLPDPAQAWAADSLGQIGIEVPDPEQTDTEDRSDAVLEVIEGTDPSERDEEFGADVADAASGGISSDMREQAEELADAEGEVADRFTPDVVDEVVPEGGDEPGDVPDQYTPDQASGSIPDAGQKPAPDDPQDEGSAPDELPSEAGENAQSPDTTGGAEQRRP